MNTTLSPVTVQRFTALQGELIGLVEQDYSGLTPKLEQFIQALEFTQIELAVFLDRHYAQGRGVGKPVADRCAMARPPEQPARGSVPQFRQHPWQGRLAPAPMPDPI